jgi:hypothetical protein
VEVLVGQDHSCERAARFGRLLLLVYWDICMCVCV